MNRSELIHERIRLRLIQLQSWIASNGERAILQLKYESDSSGHALAA